LERGRIIFDEFFEGFSGIGSLLELPCKGIIDGIYGKN
jgi:hypothetical protein